MKSGVIFVSCVLFILVNVENSMQQEGGILIQRLRRQTQDSVNQDLCNIFGVCNAAGQPIPVGTNNNPSIELSSTTQGPIVLPTSTPATSTTTPRSEQDIERCITMCPTITTYNPVCGSDGITYDNAGKLRCARSCGRPNVTQVRVGPC